METLSIKYAIKNIDISPQERPNQ